jgi:hypothetical protein
LQPAFVAGLRRGRWAHSRASDFGEATGVIARSAIDRGLSKKRFHRPSASRRINALRVIIESSCGMIRTIGKPFLTPHGTPRFLHEGVLRFCPRCTRGDGCAENEIDVVARVPHTRVVTQTKRAPEWEPLRNRLRR